MLSRALCIPAALAMILLVAAPCGADVKAGKAVYDKKCASCHGASGEGKPVLAKALKVEIRDLGSKEVQAKTDAQLKKESVDGVGKMKAVTGLSEADAANLIQYIRSLAKK